MNENTVGEQLIRALVGFPRYALSWLAGLVIVTLTQVNITLVALVGVAAGVVASDVLVGILVYLSAYAVVRTVDALAGAIHAGVTTAAQIVATQPPPIKLEARDG